VTTEIKCVRYSALLINHHWAKTLQNQVPRCYKKWHNLPRLSCSHSLYGYCAYACRADACAIFL